MILSINPNAEFSLFHDSEYIDSWLCVLPLSNKDNYRVTLSNEAYEFINLFNGIDTVENILKSNVFDLKREKFQILIDNFLIPKGILILEANDYSASDSKRKKSSYMQIQVPVIAPSVTNILSNFLNMLFKPSLALIFVLFAVLSQLIFFRDYYGGIYSIWELTAKEQIQIVLIAGIGLLFHELGHAAAAFKFGCRKVEIGVGWYICFLVFYAELSETWALNRKQRVIVDCGGMYFQIIFTMLLIYCLSITHAAIFYYSIILLNISFLWNLNPFFRMDGYWITSDLLGIANLRKATKVEFDRLISWLKKEEVPQSKLQLPKLIKHAFITYTVLSGVFFFFMIYFLSSRLFSLVTIELPEKLEAFNWSFFRKSSWLELLVWTTSSLFNLIMMTFCCLFIYRVLVFVLNTINRLKGNQ
jgi:putative peptide zinc metalloprotease protein